MNLRRVVVTGASGLLGTAVAARLSRTSEVLGLAHRHVLPGTRAWDLADAAALAQLGREPWDGLVHCAAYRSPEQCEQERAAAWRLNAEVPGALAELAARRGARLVHISTDYVFPGTTPPYREDDACQPLNYYGETKQAAEEAVRRAWPEAVVLRIPALYGEPPAPVTSALLEEALAAVASETVVELDDRIIRYPTHAADVAEVVAFLLAGPHTGVFQASAGTPVTRYQWTRLVATLAGRPAEHLRPMVGELRRTARRPLNAQLAVDKLRAAGGPVPAGCEVRLRGVLARRGLGP